MRPTPIPDHEVWPGAVRQVIAPPGGDLDSGIAPVEALIDVSPKTGRRLSVRCILEDGDLEALAGGGTVWLTFWGGMIPWGTTVLPHQPAPGEQPRPRETLSDDEADEVRAAATLDVHQRDVATWPRTVATAEMVVRLSTARERAATQRELEQLRRWKAEALPVIAGLQDLGRALGLPPGERITGPAALAAVERLKTGEGGA